MSKFIKLTLRFSIGILSVIIFIVLLMFLFGHKNYNDYNYNTPDEFLNSESFSWYLNIFPKSSNNIFLRTFIETNEMVIIFEANKADEIPISQLHAITSINRGIELLKNLNISDYQKQYFLDNGKLYCYFYQNKSPYLVSKYYSDNNEIVHYIFISLRPKEALEFCQ